MPFALPNLLPSVRRWGAAAALGASLLITPLLAYAGESPVGVWRSIDDETNEAKAHIQIYEKNGKLYGKIIKLLRNPNAICSKCTGEDKDKPVLGMRIMWGMQKDDDAWEGGRIFDPEKGKSYRCKIWIEDDGSLSVRGYLGLFFRTQTWKRVR